MNAASVTMADRVERMELAIHEIRRSTVSIQEAASSLSVVSESNSAVSEEVAAGAEETAALAGEIEATAADLAVGARELTDALSHFHGAGIGLDFAVARRMHLAWKDRIESFRAGEVELDPDAVSVADRCDLGKWIYGGSLEMYGHLRSMIDLEEQHRMLHQAIGEAVRAHLSGRRAEADAALMRMERLSGQVVGRLDELDHEV
jgi:methyl-accepting chemotaxis protein